MKRLITFLIFIMIAGATFGQALNPKGMYIGKVLPINPNSMIQRLDSATVDNMANPTLFKIYHGTTQLIPDIPAAGYDDIYLYVPKLVPDTVAVTTNITLALTDAWKRLRVTGTHINITLPPSTDVAFTKETTIYVQLMSNSVIHFVNGAGVTRVSVKDSSYANTQYKWYGIVYWGNNNYNLIGVED